MNEKEEVITMQRLPKVGEIVLSKSLKLKRVVTAVDETNITLRALRTGFYTSLFDRLSFDFYKKMSLEDFEVGYIMLEENSLDDKKFTADEFNSVFFKIGDFYKHTDTQERVMAGVSHVDEYGSRFVELHSLDRMVEGEYLTYRATEDYFKENFVSVEKKVLYKTPLSLST